MTAQIQHAQAASAPQSKINWVWLLATVPFHLVFFVHLIKCDFDRNPALSFADGMLEQLLCQIPWINLLAYAALRCSWWVASIVLYYLRPSETAHESDAAEAHRKIAFQMQIATLIGYICILFSFKLLDVIGGLANKLPKELGVDVNTYAEVFIDYSSGRSTLLLIYGMALGLGILGALRAVWEKEPKAPAEPSASVQAILKSFYSMCGLLVGMFYYLLPGEQDDNLMKVSSSLLYGLLSIGFVNWCLSIIGFRPGVNVLHFRWQVVRLQIVLLGVTVIFSWLDKGDWTSAVFQCWLFAVPPASVLISLVFLAVALEGKEPTGLFQLISNHSEQASSTSNGAILAPRLILGIFLVARYAAPFVLDIPPKWLDSTMLPIFLATFVGVWLRVHFLYVAVPCIIFLLLDTVFGALFLVVLLLSLEVCANLINSIREQLRIFWSSSVDRVRQFFYVLRSDWSFSVSHSSPGRLALCHIGLVVHFVTWLVLYTLLPEGSFLLAVPIANVVWPSILTFIYLLNAELRSVCQRAIKVQLFVSALCAFFFWFETNGGDGTKSMASTLRLLVLLVALFATIWRLQGLFMRRAGRNLLVAALDIPLGLLSVMKAFKTDFVVSYVNWYLSWLAKLLPIAVHLGLVVQLLWPMLLDVLQNQGYFTDYVVARLLSVGMNIVWPFLVWVFAVMFLSHLVNTDHFYRALAFQLRCSLNVLLACVGFIIVVLWSDSDSDSDSEANLSDLVPSWLVSVYLGWGVCAAAAALCGLDYSYDKKWRFPDLYFSFTSAERPDFASRMACILISSSLGFYGILFAYELAGGVEAYWMLHLLLEYPFGALWPLIGGIVFGEIVGAKKAAALAMIDHVAMWLLYTFSTPMLTLFCDIWLAEQCLRLLTIFALFVCVLRCGFFADSQFFLLSKISLPQLVQVCTHLGMVAHFATQLLGGLILPWEVEKVLIQYPLVNIAWTVLFFWSPNFLPALVMQIVSSALYVLFADVELAGSGLVLGPFILLASVCISGWLAAQQIRIKLPWASLAAWRSRNIWSGLVDERSLLAASHLGLLVFFVQGFVQDAFFQANTLVTVPLINIIWPLVLGFTNIRRDIIRETALRAAVFQACISIVVFCLIELLPLHVASPFISVVLLLGLAVSSWQASLSWQFCHARYEAIFMPRTWLKTTLIHSVVLLSNMGLFVSVGLNLCFPSYAQHLGWMGSLLTANCVFTLLLGCIFYPLLKSYGYGLKALVLQGMISFVLSVLTTAVEVFGLSIPGNVLTIYASLFACPVSMMVAQRVTSAIEGHREKAEKRKQLKTAALSSAMQRGV